MILKVSALETAMGRKVDRHQWDQVEVLTSKLSTYAEFKQETVEELQDFHQKINQINIRHDTLDQRIHVCQQDLQRQSTEMTKLVTRNEIRIIAKELEKVMLQMECTASKDSLDEVRASRLITAFIIVNRHKLN